MARLYADENVPMPAVRTLRELGHDVFALVESELAEQGLPDEAVLEHAMREERVLLTLNRKHFIRLHRERPAHAGVIVCTFDADFEALARRIHEALIETPDMTGRLARINRSSG